MSDIPLVTYSVELLEATINKQVERIEQLEAALRKITDLVDSEMGEPLDDAIEIARAALAPEQEK